MNRDRYNILWLIKGLGLGGAEKLLTQALPYLDRSRFAYRAGYFLPWKDALVPELTAAGLPVDCLHVTTVADLGAVPRLVRFCRDRHIDLIHAHLPHPGLVARLAGRIGGVPVVYTEHNVWERLHPAMRLLNRLTFGLNARTIAVSADVAASMGGVDRQRLRVIDNGIDCARLAATADDSAAVRRELAIPADHLVIGKVANLGAKKNHENLLHAFALFLKERPATTLVLVGQPFDRLPCLQQLAERLGIAGSVRFTGGRNDVPRIVRAFDLFVMSSDHEGLPIAMLEAMALKKPTVATTVGGIPGVVRDGLDGFLVPAQNPQALAEKMLRVANDGELALAMGESASQRVRERYDISRMVRQVEAVYCDVLEGRP
ncbi:MAG: glycosyltransferase [Desulfuromonadales bacterium]|nr:glycosyltransferase [Desulfuromonadales bacterium]